MRVLEGMLAAAILASAVDPASAAEKKPVTA